MEESLAPTSSKRPREDLNQKLVEELGEEEVDSSSSEGWSKRQKPYSHILSLLESSEEDDPSEDISSLITTLQQEISYSDNNTTPISSHQSQQNPHNSNSNSSSAPRSEREEEDDKERVMRHLLQASDDELGIPNSGDGDSGNSGSVWGFEDDGGQNGYSLCDGLWELEDETANYYALLQSQLFSE